MNWEKEMNELKVKIILLFIRLLHLTVQLRVRSSLFSSTSPLTPPSLRRSSIMLSTQVGAANLALRKITGVGLEEHIDNEDVATTLPLLEQVRTYLIDPDSQPG